VKFIVSKYLFILFIVFLFFSGFVVIGDIDNSDCWSKTEVISTESSEEAYRGFIDVDSFGTVHIAWKDRTDYNGSGDDWDVFYKRKPLNGSWSKTEVVSTESVGDCNCLDLEVESDGTVHIAWKDDSDIYGSGDDFDVLYKKKSPNSSWSDTEIVSTESFNDSNCPYILVDVDGVVHVVWSDGTDYLNSGSDFDVFYRKKLLNSWLDVEVVTINSTSNSLRPHIGSDIFGNLHLVWEENINPDESDDDWNIFYMNKKNGYDFWGDFVLVSTEGNKSSVSPDISVDVFGNVHIVWMDRADYKNSLGDYDVFYRKKAFDGFWTDTEVVSVDSLLACNWPAIDSDNSGKVYVAWNDKTMYNNSGNDYDIIFRMRDKEGYWSDSEVVTFDSNYDSYWASVSTYDDVVHFSWWDNKGGGDWVTYYKSKFCDLEIPIEDNGSDSNGNQTPGFGFFIFVFGLFLYFILFRRKIT
jgi:ribosomal protein L31